MEKGDTNIEKKLVGQLKKGDADAFEKLFQFYGKRLFHFSLGYLKSSEEAEEVVQETFFRIWNNKSSLQPERSFKAYLFTIAYHFIIATLKKKQKEQVFNDMIIETVVSVDNEFNQRTDYKSILELVEKTIEKLPQRQKEVLKLRKMEGLSINETAQKLDISSKTVEHHYTEALKKIKSELRKENLSDFLFLLFPVIYQTKLFSKKAISG